MGVAPGAVAKIERSMKLETILYPEIEQHAVECAADPSKGQ